MVTLSWFVPVTASTPLDSAKVFVTVTVLLRVTPVLLLIVRLCIVAGRPAPAICAAMPL